eukprot:UN15453
MFVAILCADEPYQKRLKKMASKAFKTLDFEGEKWINYDEFTVCCHWLGLFDYATIRSEFSYRNEEGQISENR